LDDSHHEVFLEDNENTEEDVNLEFRRVKSLREEQESKIAQFLKEDKMRVYNKAEGNVKCESPGLKYSQSVSPKKTKRIDKNKQQKLVHESD